MGEPEGMTSFERGIAAVRALYPRMSKRKAEEIVRAVLEAVAADQRPKSIGKIGEGGEATFPDPED